MGYAQRKVADTAARLAHVSSQHLKALPPKSTFAHAKSRPPAVFDAAAWASSRPAPPSTLVAFAHRVGLGSLQSVDAIQQACTHPSFVPLYTQQHPGETLPATNASLATLGNSLLGLFASEYVNAAYPHLPTRVMKAAVSAYVGPTTCANLAKEMGAVPVLRWHRTVCLILYFWFCWLTVGMLAFDRDAPSPATSRRACIHPSSAHRTGIPAQVVAFCTEICGEVLLQPGRGLAEHDQVPGSQTDPA